ncbi:M48 family metallopeptidase [Geminocystis sp. NIES-3709]|uniref:tetratricopeptide repeat protein n=1 Tax=Geminocystis sp. NIES-3709 TaxID=1617448 RepID=UPI0005FC7FCD|nr:tetratricopeptide repeat protein [Geminocystis sp. NIES-3709]BAQ64657.1 hypothetical protein GM3709_1422 [Geminocystis sp. NIES-3709]
MRIETDSLELKLKIATAWKHRGRKERAMAGYQEVLEIDRHNLLAHQYLGDLFLELGKQQEALEYYDRALTINFDETDLWNYYKMLGISSIQREKEASINTVHLPYLDISNLADNPHGKINLARQGQFHCHRSGWDFATKSLIPLHNSNGILFDGFLEKNFIWECHDQKVRSSKMLAKMKQDGVFHELSTSKEKGIIPYQQPWVGFLHNPPNIPHWLHSKDSPQVLFTTTTWQDSLNSCIGLFTLSEYLAKWLRKYTGKSVSSLIFPTEIPQVQFDFGKFIANDQKKIIQVGWWLRQLSAIYQLPIAKNNHLNYEKIILVPKFSIYSENIIDNLITEELKQESIIKKDIYWQNTHKLSHVSNERYDQILSENIVFMHLYDASANNAVIECIARATPLLVNPLPAVVEYLGEDYPMYFNNLAEAGEKAMNTSLIWDTHNYLKNCPTRAKLSGDYFLKSFEESAVYQLI